MLLNALKNDTYTSNGARAYKSTLDFCLDLFGQGAAYRERSEEDVIDLFMKAYKQDKISALKLLFYIRDVRGGQGERRFFRVVIKHLAKTETDIIEKLLPIIPEFGRWDDLWCLLETPANEKVLKMVESQLKEDLTTEYPSLLAKWMCSENTSSKETVAVARKLRNGLSMTPKVYRQTLSLLRSRINIVESLISQNKWSEIDYSKLPSKAGLQYANAFIRHDSERYFDFLDAVNCGKTKVNASTLYPYEITSKISYDSWNDKVYMSEDRMVLNTYWDAIPNYLPEDAEDALAVIDVSGSMIGIPMEVAVSLGLYVAERNKGKFKNHFITFESSPKLIELNEQDDFCDKVVQIKSASWGGSTNIKATFDLILNTALKYNLPQNELPKILYIISDMNFNSISREDTNTVFEIVKKEFNDNGYGVPHLVFWNVNAYNNAIPMLSNEDCTFVSGFSPSIFEMVAKRMTALDLMYATINKERYQIVEEVLK